MKELLTEEEKKVMNLLVDVWDNFVKLEPTHEGEGPDFRFHIDSLQRIVASRPYTRWQQTQDDPLS